MLGMQLGRFSPLGRVESRPVRFGTIGRSGEQPTDSMKLYRNWIDRASGLHVGSLKQVYFSKPPASSIAVARLALASPKRSGGVPRPEAAGKMLLDVFAQWPKGVQAQFLNTSGGFTEVPLPPGWQGKTGWQSRPQDFESLLPGAEKAVKRVLSPDVLKQARGKVDYITLAVDVTDAQAADPLKAPHAELIAVYDVKKGWVVQWTGKSYPCANQQNTLILAPLESHYFKTARGENALVLGCHDMIFFNPRAMGILKELDTPRARQLKAMWQLAKRQPPVYVLPHPHGTDTANTWYNSWMTLKKHFPGLKAGATAIGHYSIVADGVRTPLEAVLKGTKLKPEQVMDVVLNVENYRETGTGNPLWNPVADAD